jgi:hypothetical protein
MPGRASRQPAREDAAAAPDLEDRLPRAQPRHLDKSPHHLQITDCVAPGFQDRHNAESRAAESDREDREWLAARAEAEAAGTFYMTWPHHCTVGTKA